MWWLGVLTVIGVGCGYFVMGIIVSYVVSKREEPSVMLFLLWPVAVLMWIAVKVRDLFLDLVEKIKERSSKKNGNDACTEEVYRGETQDP